MNSFLVYVVLGSTGNLYTIDISHKIKCNCRDFIYRRNHCKHILMVLLKVFHLPAASPAFRSLNLSPELLQDMFSKAMPDPGVLVDEHIQKAIKAKLYHVEPSDGGSVQRRPLDTSDCPICFEEFEEKQLAKILFCKTCGNNVHEVCFVAWKKSRGSQVTCVYCRSEWPSDVKKGKKKPKSSDLNEEGYVNFAAAAGLSSKRDSTTYRLYPGAPNSWTYR
ncbi:uncharacterized protein BYT42DRAFT_46309 [Radiomyces spectabilis]|uniref:uncharacterized protein n=1 Tax=Radiomyces spectabilis TaxID=64574 RepID=UPI0022202AF0|nr:uncharacterized protein BYT42DRAFT_46309 [Radiomyces spectabilis]KAI8372797.1 hypothetical protein BYT42DRAFT_46309 [Radiomyces spectabilis]